MSQVLQGPIYTTVDNVKVRLANKIQFETPGGLLDGEMPNALLCQLIKRAETKVELLLRSRFAIPFRSARTAKFCDLPDHTKAALQTVIDDRAVMEILKTDFGRGTHTNAENYYKDLDKDFKDGINHLLGRDYEGANAKHDRFRFAPPIEDLALATSNCKADDGFKGMIINTDNCPNVTNYAEDQINNPSQNWLRRRVHGL
jgi:hypothetical protein